MINNFELPVVSQRHYLYIDVFIYVKYINSNAL